MPATQFWQIDAVVAPVEGEYKPAPQAVHGGVKVGRPQPVHVQLAFQPLAVKIASEVKTRRSAPVVAAMGVGMEVPDSFCSCVPVAMLQLLTLGHL